MVRMCYNGHIRTIVILTGGKLTAIYFLYLLSANLLFAMTYLLQGKKVSIFMHGDVNSGPIASR
jgi:hypothetical protein